MAECIRYVCGNCQKAVEAWSDGNPYYLDEQGRKQYAYHPDHERLNRCIGNDSPHLCLECGKKFMVDSRAPIDACPKCKSGDIADTYRLDGRRCPWCQTGVFAADSDFMCIS
jgi:DNA-directed RNA polymerase subunit RPC12/RpoP